MITATLMSAAVALATASPATEDYDANLCASAQRLVVGAPSVDVHVVTGEGNGFHTIQMDIDTEQQRLVVAASSLVAEFDGTEVKVGAACKMVNAERVADVLSIAGTRQPLTCGDINEITYATALDTLTPAEQRRYQTQGVPLQFAPDYPAGSGGEWLPLSIDDHIVAVTDEGGDVQHIQISAPSVRVPWDSQTREFYQGTQHCKLITAAAMRRWMRIGAFDGSTALFPPTKRQCSAPAAESSAAGSCLFWFAPAQSMFCKDYTGQSWTVDSAQAECSVRHASAAALKAADSRYQGVGGVYRQTACQERADAAPLHSTCVFNCNADDESLWRQSGESTLAGAATMTSACDLFVE